MRPSVVGDVQGEGGTGAVSGGARGSWCASWWSGPARAGVGRAGVAGARGARQVLDSGSACSAPAITDRVWAKIGEIGMVELGSTRGMQGTCLFPDFLLGENDGLEGDMSMV